MSESNISVSVRLTNIDPVLLRDQRLALLKIRNNNLNNQFCDELSGIINLLDEMADAIYNQTGCEEKFIKEEND